MRCMITGVETNNKFNNRPVSSNAIKSAKELRKHYPHKSMWQCLNMLREEILQYTKEQMEAQDKVIRKEVPHVID